MFNDMSLREFNRRFSSDDDCRQYLFNIKWKNGFCCRKCGYGLAYPGETRFHQRCQSCDYGESVTAGTLFHKIKFPLLKAFGIAFAVTVRKKGMSTLELARSFSIRQSTAWLFKRKLQEAMRSGRPLLSGEKLEVHEIIIGGAGREKQSRFKGSEKRARISIQIKGRKLGSGWAEVMETGSSQESETEKKEKAKTARVQQKKKAGKNLKKCISSDIVIMNLRNWLSGIHHHCSGRFVQGYLHEFFFRFNRRSNLKGIWHQLIETMMSQQPYFYKPSEA